MICAIPEPAVGSEILSIVKRPESDWGDYVIQG